MPPKIKTDEAAILAAALAVARRGGMSALSAKSIATELSTSVAPIFRVFQSMDEVKSALLQHVKKLMLTHLKTYPRLRSEFLTYGIAYIDFAQTEPRLFDALMASGFFETDVLRKVVAREFDFVVKSATTLAGLSPEQGKRFFFHVWFYTHGVACMCAMGARQLSREDIVALLDWAFRAFLTQERSET